MKTALVLFKPARGIFDTEALNKMLFSFENGGIAIDTVEVLSSNDDLGFKRRYDELKNTADNLIIGVPSYLSFDIKEMISKDMDSELIENENALEIIQEQAIKKGVDYDSSYALIPIGATLIPNVNGAFQGFMIEDESFSLVVVSQELSTLVNICDGYVVPYFEAKCNIKPKKYVFKYFGESSAIERAIKKAEEIYGKEIKYSMQSNNGDNTVLIRFTEEELKEKEDEALRAFSLELGDGLYAEIYTSLGERVFDLLRLRKLRLCVAESFTSGRVVAEVLKNPGASEFVNEGLVTYSNESKVYRLGVNQIDLDAVGAVSSKVAYQMAAGLLKRGNCDVAVATTGIAGPKSDNTSKPVGLAFIAVGSKKGIHVYKNQFVGDREEITETAKNTALFLAMKNIKNY